MQVLPEDRMVVREKKLKLVFFLLMFLVGPVLYPMFRFAGYDVLPGVTAMGVIILMMMFLQYGMSYAMSLRFRERKFTRKTGMILEVQWFILFAALANIFVMLILWPLALNFNGLFEVLALMFLINTSVHLVLISTMIFFMVRNHIKKKYSKISQS